MNFRAPISSVMTTQLITVGPNERLSEVKKIFDTHKIHHIPVVHDKNIVGMISKSDLLQVYHGMRRYAQDASMDIVRLDKYLAEDIMTTGLAKLDVDDKVNVAIEVFKENLFHALPVVKNEELVGIITTFDIIRMLSSEDDQRIAALRS